MKLKNKIKLILLMSFVLLGMLSVKCFATSISVSPSKRTVAPGESFSVTISGSDATGRVNISASNGTVSQSSAWIENNSVTVTVKAGSSGTVTVSASGELSSNSGVDKNVSGSTSVSIQSSNNGGNTGNQGGTSSGGNSSNNSGNSGNSGSSGNQGGSTAVTKDSNANLSNLGITPNDFRGFTSGKTEYSVNVPNDVTSINVYAKASSTKASVSGTGNKTLTVGTNKFSVVVVAENGNKKTYTISVNRAGENGETIPNVIDEEPTENTEEPSAGVGLASLTIEGYELDKEFKTEEHEYVISVKEDLTLEDLEAIKAKIAAVTNSDKVTTEMVAEISEEGKKTITIIVKDEEKEYSRYVITFEKEEKEETAAVLMTNNSNSGNTSKGIFGLSPEKQIYVVLGCFGVTLLMAIYFACVAYVKSKRLAEYEEDVYEEENENSEFEKMNQYYVGFEGTQNESIQRNEEVENLGKDEFSEDTVEEVTSTLGKLGGYRSMRNKSKSAGRHF